MALETFSATELVCFRYLITGTLLLCVARISGAHLPHGRELWMTAACGIVVLGIGNACLAFAEELIPSGLAALFVSTSPFWLVGIEALAPRGERLHVPTIRGMLVGAAGVAFLVAPEVGRFSTNRTVLAGFVILQLGCAGWAAGSIAQRKTPARAHPFVSGAVQQLATGIVYAIPVALHSQPIHWKLHGVLAICYLMIFGTIVGYSCYIYAMDRLPVAVASIYTYVNPLIAVLLGWLVYEEPFGTHEAVAMAIIFVGVAMVKRAARVARAK
jgi:drug/metabolite transporter (DMT)-like permease